MTYRLIHDGSIIIGYFEAVGVTTTPHIVFEGTKSQCINEIVRLNLKDSNNVLPSPQPRVYSKLLIRRNLRAIPAYPPAPAPQNIAVVTPLDVAGPAKVTPPSITGDPSVGAVLTCDAGSWSGSPKTYFYQWYRLDGTLLLQDTVAQTADFFTIPVLCVGSYVCCGVSAIDNAGNSSDVAFTSFIGPIETPPIDPPPPPPDPPTEPVIPPLTKEDLFNSFLSSNPIASADWNDSTEISNHDPSFLQHRGDLIAALKMDDDSFDAVLNNSMI
jgi:hypothetical protein